MQRVHILLLSGLVLACLAEDVKQTKPDSKDKSEPNGTAAGATHKSSTEMSLAMSNHSSSDAAGKMTNKPENAPKEEDMKSSATVGLGFYAGVVPFGYPSYPGYPYYRSYYARPYWGYSYRPVPVVITQPVVRPRPLPVLLG